jgi:hypothetical protein
MAALPTLTTKAVLAQIAKALVDFAKEQGWNKDQYRILFRVLEDWGHIRVMLVVDDFGGRSDRELWEQVHDRLERSLKQEGGTGFSVGLVVRERGQVEKRGRYAIADTYVEAADLLPASSLDH